MQGEQAVLGWVRAAAVARMVHGDGHWKCAQYHVCTARCYLDLQGICSIYICLNTCGLIWGLRCAGSLTCYMVIVVSLLVTMQL